MTGIDLLSMLNLEILKTLRLDTIRRSGYNVVMKSMRKKRQGRPPVKPELQAIRRCIRVTDEEFDGWSRAANRKGVTLSAWVRRACAMRMK